MCAAIMTLFGSFFGTVLITGTGGLNRHLIDLGSAADNASLFQSIIVVISFSKE